MKVSVVACAYNEPRFIAPWVHHLPNWLDEIVILNSIKPWHGEPIAGEDQTARLAQMADKRVVVLQDDWPTEHEQRNSGQEYLFANDWVVTLDPDEFLDNYNWHQLHQFLIAGPPHPAYVCQAQNTYWKSGYAIRPREEYRQIILTKPGVRYVDKRVVETGFGVAPVTLDHFSWARTDEEIWNKITHYGHAHEIDASSWFDNIWKKWNPEMENLHPLTPAALKKAEPTLLPQELEELHLWPPKAPRTNKT